MNKGTVALLMASAGFLGLGYVLSKKKKKPKATVRKIAYEVDGETFTTLGKGGRIVVTWDPSSPFGYKGIPSEITTLVPNPKAYSIEFVVTKTMPKDAIDEVYVQAIDDQGEKVGEHRIVIQGP